MSSPLSSIASECEIACIKQLYSAPVFDLQSVGGPTIDLSGSLTNVNLTIHMYDALPGIPGAQGVQGVQGNTGNSNLPGIQGTIGYYGMRGDSVK